MRREFSAGTQEAAAHYKSFSRWEEDPVEALSLLLS